MEVTSTDIPDVLVLTPAVHGDERGFFMETWRQSLFDELVPGTRFVQDNHSKSRQGILRGLHYQLEQPQGKLVRVVYGDIHDVAVDLRADSKTFGESVGVHLSAHGFYVISETAEMVYKCTEYYAPDDEYTLLWNDPALDIHWPLVPGAGEPVLSEKDRLGRPLRDLPVYR